MKNQTVKKLFAIALATTLAGSMAGCGNVANVETDAPVKQEASATTPEEKPEKKEPVIAKTVKASEEDVKAFVEHDVFEGIEDADVTEGTHKDLLDAVKIHNKDLVKDIKVEDKTDYDKAGSYDVIFTLQFDKKELVKFIEEHDLTLTFDIDKDADIIQVEAKVQVTVTAKESAKKPATKPNNLVIHTGHQKGQVVATANAGTAQKPVVKPAVRPAKPNVPVVPDKPAKPNVPIVPDKPARPNVPVVPDKPVTPEKPSVPMTPLEPSKPIMKPSVPMTPLEPAKPIVKPSVPMTPLEPAKPIVKPSVPMTPLEPAKPIVKPSVPMTPLEPAKPIVKPSVPMTPLEPAKPIVKPSVPMTPLEPAKPIEHHHNWTPIYRTEVIPEKGHYETVVVTPEKGHYETVIVTPEKGHYETVTEYEVHTICNQCGMDFGAGLDGPDLASEHIIDSALSGGSCGGYHLEQVKVKKQKWVVDKEAVTEQKWIVDKEAVTEQKWIVDQEESTKQVLDHWICKECGETKPAKESESDK